MTYFGTKTANDLIRSAWANELEDRIVKTEYEIPMDETVVKVGTTYYAYGHADYSGTLASVLTSIVADTDIHNIYLKQDATWTLSADVIINRDPLYILGSGWANPINVDAGSGISIAHTANLEDGITFRNISFNGQSATADYCIRSTGMTNTKRVRFLTVDGCRFYGFYKAGVNPIDIKNPELIKIKNSRFTYISPTGSLIKLTNDTYNAGNIWLINNWIYVGSATGGVGGHGVHIENGDTTHARSIGVIWSRGNQYYSDPTLGGDSVAVYLKSTQGGIEAFKSVHDRFERIQALHCETPGSSYSIRKCEVSHGHIFDSYANNKLFWFDTNTYRNTVSNNTINEEIATGVIWDDDSTISEFGYENAFLDNDCLTTGVGDFASTCKYSRVMRNRMFNATASKAMNPHLLVTASYVSGTTFTPYGTGSTVEPSTDYKLRYSDALIYSTDSGDANSSISCDDSNGNAVWSGKSTLDWVYVPFGSIVNWGAFTHVAGGHPTVKFYWL